MRVKGLSVLLSAVLVCGVIFTGCTGEDKTESKKVAESSSDASTQKEASAQKEDSNSSEEVKGDKGSEEEKYHPGDVVAFGDFKITYKSIKKYKSDNQFLQPKEGFQYIKYVFSFENTGKKDFFVGNFACYADGEKCDSAYVDNSDSDLLISWSRAYLRESILDIAVYLRFCGIFSDNLCFGNPSGFIGIKNCY